MPENRTDLISDETLLFELQESLRPEFEELLVEAFEEDTAVFRVGVAKINGKNFYFSFTLSEAS
jgi:hypothetical protein